MKTYKVTKNNEGTIRWHNEDGQLHREDGPAVERANGDKEYYLNEKDGTWGTYRAALQGHIMNIIKKKLDQI